MAKFDASLLLVLTTFGLINREASQAKFDEYLDLQEKEQDSGIGLVSMAVHKVFDNNPGAKLNLPAVVSFAFPLLNVPGSEFSSWKAKIETYIRNNSKDDGAFSMGRGRDGGVRRVCDIPVQSVA